MTKQFIANLFIDISVNCVIPFLNLGTGLLLFKLLSFSPVCFSGWIVSLSVSRESNKAVAAIMIISSVLFTAQAFMGVILLKRVNHISTNSSKWISSHSLSVKLGI